MSKYVVLQAGGPAYGFGSTKTEAFNDSQEWIDEECKGQEIPFISYLTEYNQAAMKGQLIITECTEKYYKEALTDSSIMYDFIDGIIC